MSEKLSPKTQEIMNQRFHHDSLLSVATIENNTPFVRTVDALYEDGAFYVVTYALSCKMQQIAKDPHVAVCGEWFNGHGIGENLGYIKKPENEEIANKLRTAFAAWYSNGHTNEDDPNTCILCIHMTDGILFADGARYDLDFTK